MSGGALSMNAHVNDSIILPSSSTHPLWFDGGSSTCLVAGGTSSGPVTYQFLSAGTYYFHCGNHARTCATGACGSTNCTAMAGTVTVN
jgi:hypothetical protein